MPDTLEKYLQQLDLPNVVELFSITYENVVYNYTNSLEAGTVYWDNRAFGSLALTISGINYTDSNTSETPKIALSNVASRLAIVFGQVPNLKGATLEYVRTFEPFTGATALEATSSYIFKRSLTFSKLLSKTANSLVYELTAVGSYPKMKYPRRQMLRDGLPKMRFEGLGINKTTS